MKFKLTWALTIGVLAFSNIDSVAQQNKLQLWYDEPAPQAPLVYLDSLNSTGLIEATPTDYAWENWSLPIGNGYLGASIFGRTETERIQITENSMASKSLYRGVGLTNFAEMYLDINHENPTEYKRSLRINDAVSTVQYNYKDVIYKREYFASYPDKVLVVKLSANRGGKISFTLRPKMPYKKEFGEKSNYNGRDGKVTAQGDVITLSGKLEHLNISFEGQFKVISSGGNIQAFNDGNQDQGRIEVSNADSVVILVAVGTNYQLKSSVFTEHESKKKLEGNQHPHEKVSSYIALASQKSYDRLLNDHVKDYTKLFSKVDFTLGVVDSKLTTDSLLKNYKTGIIDPYLEELYFQYGRYLLICSSRPGTLPPNLQGIWSQYDITPWTGGYWHNINIQMNYWPAFNTNLTELFQPFVEYNLAYREAAAHGAAQYIRKNNPQKLSNNPEENGWTIGTGATAYNISTPGVHSGPGTGTMTSKLFWDYYEFTGDKKILRKLTYPAIFGMSTFLSKVVIDTMGLLLASPSYSPEQRFKGKHYYKTTGSAFDQQMIYESHNDVIKASIILKDKNSFITELKEQITKLDPVQIGKSGQIKEYREEQYYSEIGDPKHRHTSQLIGLYPGTVITSHTPAWLDAAKKTLELRGDKATGWGMAFRLNLWARAKEGNRAYQILQTLLQKSTLDNLWDTHPPFQIDGNFGATAGIAEMLLQSHEGLIELLPALPTKWKTGSFKGLLARGNFEVAAEWSNGSATAFIIKSNIGGVCKLKYPNLGHATIRNSMGKLIHKNTDKNDVIFWITDPGDIFTISNIPITEKVDEPTDLVVLKKEKDKTEIGWHESKQAIGYNIYVNFGNSPNYKLIKSDVRDLNFIFNHADPANPIPNLIKVTAINKSRRESKGVSIILD